MDPSKVQADTSNDVHSLEQDESGAVQSAPNQVGQSITDATEPSPQTPPPNPFKHRSFIRRVWDKFNIYLLLFIFVMILAIGSLVGLTAKSQQESKKTPTSQELSKDAIKQLANTDVTVGKPSEILTVQANAVFSGTVLVRDNLEVAGTIKIGRDLSLGNLTVTGNSKLSDATVNNLTVGSNLNVQAAVTLKNGLSVAGQSNFTGGLVASSITTGALQFNGDLNLTNHVVAGGTMPTIAKGTAVGSGGTASLSGSDTAGTVTINSGSSPPAGCLATVTFTKAFKTTPHVVITPVGSAAATLDYYVTRTTTTFAVCTASPAPSGQSFSFDYMVLG